jgi:hypothetical protein
MILVVTILAALLAGAATALYLQINSTRAAGVSNRTRSALYCAEAGLARARIDIASNPDDWAAILDPNEPDPAYYPIRGDLVDDNDTTTWDYEVTVEDNPDEFPPNPEDPTVDSDERIIIRSKCVKYSNTPREVLEVISLEANPGTNYKEGAGRDMGNTGSLNVPP